MDLAQFNLLIDTLNSLSSSMAQKPYTLTGAEDWPILAYVGTGFFAMMAVMWGDLKGTIRQEGADLRADLDKEERERQRQDSLIWKAISECQHECFPDRRQSDRRKEN